VSRFSRKRSDKRWIAEDGDVFASKLEWLVYEALRQDSRLSVRRCVKGEGDTFDYVSKVRSGECTACKSGEIVQRRTYTPDLHIVPTQRGSKSKANGPGYYLEIKGHFPGPKRKLLGDFLKTGPTIDLRLLLQRDGKATPKLTQLEYAVSRLKLPVHVWDGQLPRDWYVNRLVHEHTSRAMSAGTKAQRRAIQVSQLEQENERLKRDYAKVVSLLQAYGVPNVQSC
jgi:hypothetical protein